MWDLTVDVDHNFYVGVAASAVLVHNCPDGVPDFIYRGGGKSLSNFRLRPGKSVVDA